MRKLSLFLAISLLFICAGCVRVPFPDETDVNLNPWMLVEDLEPNQAILNTYAVSDALFLLTNDEFISISKENNVLKRLTLPGNFSRDFRPAIASNLYVRPVDGTSLEFRLTKNDFEMRSIKIDAASLGLPASDQIELESGGKEIGAFNDGEDKFMIAVSNQDKNLHTFIIFQTLLDGSTTEFRSFRVVARIDIPEIPVGFDQIGAIKFVGNFWYVASKEGAFKIHPTNRTYEKLSPDYHRDIFRRNGKIYITSFAPFDMLISDDNGETWTDTPAASPLRWVTTAGGALVSQDASGKEFKTPIDEANIFELGEMRVNRAMLSRDFGGLFNSFSYFNQNFYLAVGKELYFSPELLLEEE